MAWALACAAAAAAVFFGLWQRERAARARAEAAAARATAQAEHHDHLDDVRRLEGLVDALKRELDEVENAYGATAGVAALRRRLDSLLRPPADPSAGGYPGLPAQPASDATPPAGP